MTKDFIIFISKTFENFEHLLGPYISNLWDHDINNLWCTIYQKVDVKVMKLKGYLVLQKTIFQSFNLFERRFEQTLTAFTWGCFMPGLVVIGSVSIWNVTHIKSLQTDNKIQGQRQASDKKWSEKLSSAYILGGLNLLNYIPIFFIFFVLILFQNHRQLNT